LILLSFFVQSSERKIMCKWLKMILEKLRSSARSHRELAFGDAEIPVGGESQFWTYLTRIAAQVFSMSLFANSNLGNRSNGSYQGAKRRQADRREAHPLTPTRISLSNSYVSLFGLVSFFGPVI